jgi:APA family basic amino acid/polyamine antiporter
MVGAGIFTVLGPAADAAGSALLAGLAIAAFVAYANATSSAQLAALYPTAGGAYAYGRARLGPFWGDLAGWAFVVGKTASCSAMALTVGVYAAPSQPRLTAIVAVAGLAAVNLRGVRKTALLTRIIVGVVLLALSLVVVAAAFGGHAELGRIAADDVGGVDVRGVLRAAALLFFAFAGYARLATLGEEVVEPARTIPKAIPRALGIALIVYAAVAVSALAAIGPDSLASSDAPLATVVQAGDLDVVLPAVRVGGTVAALGVLLSLLAGVSRTTFAMAADGVLPRALASVHPSTKVPHLAELAISGAVVAVVALVDVRHAIGFSSFCVLGYYTVANAAAWTLPPGLRRWPRALAGAGIVGCVVLAVTLPIVDIAAGTAVLVVGAIASGVGGWSRGSGRSTSDGRQAGTTDA